MTEVDMKSKFIGGSHVDSNIQVCNQQSRFDEAVQMSVSTLRIVNYTEIHAGDTLNYVDRISIK